MNIGYARGGSSIIAPLGVQMLDSSFDPGIIYADCPAWMIKAVKAIVDTVGHYSRPDLLRLAVMGPEGWEIAATADEFPVGFGDRLSKAMQEREVHVPVQSVVSAVPVLGSPERPALSGSEG